jgi:hypothetical protein
MQRFFFTKLVLAVAVLTSARFSPAAADTVTSLFSFTNAAAQVDTAESTSFVASTTISTLSFAGYQIPEWEMVTHAVLRQNGVAPLTNLLNAGWDFVKAAQGSDAFEIVDGSVVPGLQFGGLAGQYDSFSQVVTTLVGASYTLSFLYTNNAYGLPPGNQGSLLVNYIAGDAPPGVPETSTWAMMLLGFAALAMRVCGAGAGKPARR